MTRSKNIVGMSAAGIMDKKQKKKKKTHPFLYKVFSYQQTAATGRGLKTKLGRALLPLNSQAGLVTAGWGSTGFMVFTMVAFLLFLTIILQLYNSTILLDDFELSWADLPTG
mmetsp:Transcript_103030/g.188019  ORF Transcript_103030/g.188019 Transcript_103030/m.188019 type:complete len:112 (-) Transcript_103030:20-355(-)